MKKSFLGIAITTAVGVLAISNVANAGFAINGLSFNGLTTANGLSINGLTTANGLSINGLSTSKGFVPAIGLHLKAISLHGMTAQGSELPSINVEGGQLVAVE